MSEKNCIKSIAAATGVIFVGGLSIVNLAGAAENPFGTTRLQKSGHMVLAENSVDYI